MVKNISETFTVKGMVCPGCEGIIEAELIEIEGIDSVKAEFDENTVTISYNPGQVSFKDLTAKLKNTCYTLIKADGEIQQNDKKNRKSISTLQFVGIVIILIALYFIINSTVGFNLIPQLKTSMGYGVLFMVGLLTSLHCVAMCGGINISQCLSSGAGYKAGVKVKPSLLYSFGRVTSYTIIGGIVGTIGSAISFSGWARGIIAVISGLFMIIMGLSMTGIFPWITKITPRLPSIFRVKAGSAGKGRGPYIIGLLNGLMPCGPLQAMQLYALGTGSFAAGALSMFFFSLGTIPLMFCLGTAVTILGSKFTKKMMAASAVLVAVLGFVMLGRGMALSGVQIPSFGIQSVSTVSQSASNVNVKDGVQNITTILSSGGYPTITVQKGIPVIWNMKAGEDNLNGCNRALIISKYDIKVTLKPGDNIIKFTPNESGAIQYTCWMGMIKGQIKVVEDLGNKTAQAATDSAPSSVPLFPGGCCKGGSAT